MPKLDKRSKRAKRAKDKAKQNRVERHKKDVTNVHTLSPEALTLFESLPPPSQMEDCCNAIADHLYNDPAFSVSEGAFEDSVLFMFSMYEQWVASGTISYTQR